MRHCTKCGSELQEQTEPTGRFDADHGLPTERVWIVCPRWRRLGFMTNGHSWHYYNERPINPPRDYFADPGKVENPPSPPGWPA